MLLACNYASRLNLDKPKIKQTEYPFNRPVPMEKVLRNSRKLCRINTKFFHEHESSLIGHVPGNIPAEGWAVPTKGGTAVHVVPEYSIVVLVGYGGGRCPREQSQLRG
jgi:hypothetical protein